MRRPVESSTNPISSCTATVPISNSSPVYMPSVFSRTITRSTASYTLGTPGYSLHGRTFA